MGPDTVNSSLPGAGIGGGAARRFRVSVCSCCSDKMREAACRAKQQPSNGGRTCLRSYIALRLSGFDVVGALVLKSQDLGQRGVGVGRLAEQARKKIEQKQRNAAALLGASRLNLEVVGSIAQRSFVPQAAEQLGVSLAILSSEVGRENPPPKQQQKHSIALLLRLLVHASASL